MKKFSVILKKLRKDRGISAKELAEKVGVHSSTILTWEKGKGKPNLVKLIKLADFFKIKLDQLIGLQDL